MEQKEESKPSEKMKPCPYCRKEIGALAKKCPYCQSDVRNFVNRHPIMTVLLIVVAFIIFVSIVSAVNNSGGNSPTTTTPSVQVAATPPSGPCGNFDDSSATTSISYAELNKDPTLYDGTNAVYTGQVVQIEQNPDGSGIMRLAITKEDYGWNPNNILYITYAGGTNAVDDDIVKVYGQLTGSQTYTSEANYQITIPSMTACEIDDRTQAQAATPTPQVKTPAPQTPAPTQPTAAANPTPTPPVTPKTWHTVTIVTAATTENTPPFNIQGNEWRATWSCQAGSSGDVPPSIFAQATDGDGGDAIATPSSCPSNNVTYLYDGPATDYLQITSFGGDSVTVTIEDYY